MKSVEKPVRAKDKGGGQAVDSAGTSKSAPGHSAGGRTSNRTPLRRALSFRNMSAVYVLVALVMLFSLWVPDTFLRVGTWRTLLNGGSVTAILAIAMVIGLSAGVFDLAIGMELGLGSILVALFLAKHGLPIGVAIVLTLLAGAVVGLANGALVVKVRIDSFIATLGMSSLLIALIAWVSNSQQILGLPESFQRIATLQILGITLPIYMMLAVALAAWYVLERTPLGRRLYATGGNINAARLAGVRTSAFLVGAMMAGATIASFAGILVSASLGTGDPTIGPAYLLPAFSAAFLGSTQFRGGRFNVWGTVLAVYVLATGVKGLQLAGAPTWIPDLFNGVALLLAVGMARFQLTRRRAGAIRRALRFDKSNSDAGTPRGTPGE